MLQGTKWLPNTKDTVHSGGVSRNYNIFVPVYIFGMPDFHLTTAIWYVNPWANMVVSLSSWLNQEAVYLFEHLLYCLRVRSHAPDFHCGFNCGFRGINLNEKDCVLLYLEKLS